MILEAPTETALTVLGVRHHSPACARLVARTIEALRPAFVLIEGPSDFNPRIDELMLDHAPPIAIFSFHSGADGSQASYAPFCAASPEWQALQSARQAGATPLFCDLPAWDPAFGDRRNRYADPHNLRAEAAGAALAEALGAEGQDALWDTLAEAAEADALPARLDRYFALLRPPGTPDAGEAARETCMGAHAAWAVGEAKGRPVVLVCGGWHADAVRRLAAAADGRRPKIAAPAEGVRTGSYLVPYSYARLDRFSGYAAGMPSPAYYERVHDGGVAVAAEWAADAIADAMRKAGQVVSTADRIAWQLHAEALARLRAHPAILRADLLDAALAALVKDGLETPAAWTRGESRGGAGHPAVGAMLRALSGEREGTLAPGTRQPPLVADVEERLRQAALMPERVARRVALDWADPPARERARLLHGLRILELPGIARHEGPADAEPGAPQESFEIVRDRHWEGALIEASQWGGTLAMAAAARLTARVDAAPDDLAVLAGALTDALFAGLLGLESDLAARLAQGVSRTREVAGLGAAGRRIVRLYRYGEAFGATQPALAGLAEALFSRALTLVEQIADAREGLDAVPLLVACRDLFRDCPELALERPAFSAMLQRRLADPEAPPAVAGGALGCLVACGEGDATAEAAAARIRRFGRPDTLGDFLAGLFALAREELGDAEAAMGAIETLVAAWPGDDFLRALPSLRMAFAWFPPRERERLAIAFLRRRGAGAAQAESQALAWMRQRAGVAGQAAALARESRVAARLARHGLT